jgi:serine/threonine-protein kinase
VDAAIRKALEKLPADRFTRADAFARALADPAFRPGGQAGSAGALGAWNRLSAGMTGLAAARALALGWSVFGPGAPAPLRPAKRFEIAVGPTQPIAPVNVHAYPALSPDGTRLVFAANRGDGLRLYVRNIDRLDVRALAGTQGAYSPFFSPDGEWVAYHDPAQLSLKKVSIQGASR